MEQPTLQAEIEELMAMHNMIETNERRERQTENRLLLGQSQRLMEKGWEAGRDTSVYEAR